MEEFVTFTDSEKEQVIDLLGAAAARRRVWDWQYCQNPDARGASPGTMIRAHGRIVGFIGTMPTRVSLDGSIVEAGWGTDAQLREELRGRGLGKKLYAIMEVTKPVMLAFGMSDVSYALFNKHGWQFSADSEEYYFQNRVSNIRDLLKAIRQLPSLARRARTSQLDGIEDVPAGELPRECDALWESVQNGYGRIVVRDYAYLKWKYADHPSGDYRALLARSDDRLCAVGIYRRGYRRARFVDYLGRAEDADVKSRLIGAFMLKSRRSRFFNIITSDREFKECVRRLGFQLYESRPQFCVRSSLLIERPAERWFLMTGDSDGDSMDAMKDSITTSCG